MVLAMTAGDSKMLLTLMLADCYGEQIITEQHRIQWNSIERVCKLEIHGMHIFAK